jgi:hypothetical protein
MACRCSNPGQCAHTRKPVVTDRAKRYRANQPGCLPVGRRICAGCGSRHQLMVDHRDGNESNGAKSNLRWLCRSCNTKRGAAMAKAGKGKRTRQYNPGAKTLGAYTAAVATHTRGAHDESGRIIHETPKSKRREYAGEIWDRRKSHGNPKLKVGKKSNIFGLSKKEKSAKRKKVSGGATEARGAGYRYATHKSDENFQEWMDRKDFGDAKGDIKARLAGAFSMGYDRGKKELEAKEVRVEKQREKVSRFKEASEEKRRRADKKRADAVDRKIEREMREKGLRNPKWGFGVYVPGIFGDEQIAHFSSKQAAQAYVRLEGLKGAKVSRAFEKKNPAKSAAQYRLAQAVLAGTARQQSMTKKAAQEIISKTPPKLRAQFMRVTGGTVNGVRARNPEELGRKAKLAAELSEKFHGRPADEFERVIEYEHVDTDKAKLGDLVRLVIDTPTGKVFTLNFSQRPRDVVRLATRPIKNEKGEVIGKQLYFVGGDQEVNLKAMGMGGPEWVRDRMELGRLHHFPKKANEGSIVYRTKKQMHNLKLTDYWHRAGEESVGKVGQAALPLVIYDHRNKHLELAGGQYYVDAPGIIN